MLQVLLSPKDHKKKFSSILVVYNKFIYLLDIHTKSPTFDIVFGYVC
uniref:Uncharacterized protein n=1 Tax=Rhizophora mucronata TaxID=61149 RepID=A0A2P2PM08_RHIMU